MSDSGVVAARVRWVAVSIAAAPFVLLVAAVTVVAPVALVAGLATTADPALLRFAPWALAAMGLGLTLLVSVVKIPLAFRIRYRRHLRGDPGRADDVRVRVDSLGVVELWDAVGGFTPGEQLGGPLGFIDRHPWPWLIAIGVLLALGVVALVVEVLLAG